MIKDLSTDELAKILWDYNNIAQKLEKADCILVLGSHDIRVAQRGAELFLEGWAPLIIFSGYLGRLTDGIWEKSEAEIFAQEAMKMGVPQNKILIENKSRNTGENIIFTKKLLEEKRIKVDKIILVQKPFMLRRSMATIKKVWSEKEVVVTAPKIDYENYPNKLIAKDIFLNTMVGDMQRIKVYAEMGFQIQQKIPKKVWQAYEELVRRGFDKYLI